MNAGSYLLSGLVATMVLTIAMAGSQWIGYSRMSLPFIIGTMFTVDHDRARAIGFVLHLASGVFFALAYVGVFEELGRATPWLGALGGLIHGAFLMAVVLPILPSVHPRMATERHGPSPTRRLQPPSFLGLHYGRRTPLIEIGAHVAYGAILGALYQVAV